jgi:hypothetical protein
MRPSGKKRITFALVGLLIGAGGGAVAAVIGQQNICCLPFEIPGELLLNAMSLTSSTGCGMSVPNFGLLLPANTVACAIIGMLLGLIPIPKRYQSKNCQKCGYNLSGNTSGMCPECGERI